MRNYIMGFITAVSLTVGIAGAYVPYNISDLTTSNLKELITEAINDAARDGAFRR